MGYGEGRVGCWACRGPPGLGLDLPGLRRMMVERDGRLLGSGGSGGCGVRGSFHSVFGRGGWRLEILVWGDGRGVGGGGWGVC